MDALESIALSPMPVFGPTQDERRTVSTPLQQDIIRESIKSIITYQMPLLSTSVPLNWGVKHPDAKRHSAGMPLYNITTKAKHQISMNTHAINKQGSSQWLPRIRYAGCECAFEVRQITSQLTAAGNHLRSVALPRERPRVT